MDPGMGEGTHPFAANADSDGGMSGYRRMFIKIVLAVSAVGLLPLLTMSAIAFHQYQQAFHTESTRPLSRFVEAGEQALESFLSERLAGLADNLFFAHRAFGIAQRIDQFHAFATARHTRAVMFGISGCNAR